MLLLMLLVFLAFMNTLTASFSLWYIHPLLCVQRRAYRHSMTPGARAYGHPRITGARAYGHPMIPGARAYGHPMIRGHAPTGTR